MPSNRWVDTTQPQTLFMATILLYFTAGSELLLLGGLTHFLWWPIVAGQIAAGFGIANEKKWGYGLGIAVAILPFILLFTSKDPFAKDLISVLFDVALVALLLHRQSREYQRIWFK